MLDVDESPFETTIERGIVTIDPVPQVKLIPRPDGSNVGYIEFAQFISTADAELEQAFAQFGAPENNVSDLIIDMRYNGGGLVQTAELLGDLLGGFVAENLLFSETRFNADRSDQNRFRNFALRANSINLSRLVVIATENTASASELVANGMAPHVEVTIVGSNTFGKPIGQSGFEFCENILRLTAFQLLNADGFGGYFDGLPVTPGCEAPDDISVGVGDDADPNIVVALSYLDNNACPGAPAMQSVSKPAFRLPSETRRTEPARIYSDSL
jgi:C-terminal processing protease CtpA/Prc